jgi:hypothetical protein
MSWEWRFRHRGSAWWVWMPGSGGGFGGRNAKATEARFFVYRCARGLTPTPHCAAPVGPCDHFHCFPTTCVLGWLWSLLRGQSGHRKVQAAEHVAFDKGYGRVRISLGLVGRRK